MPNSLVYENDNYSVDIDPNRDIFIEGNKFVGVYVVTNKHTDVEEFYTPCLPEALRIAVHWDIAISRENHLWPYKHFDNDVDEDAIPAGELLQ